MSQTINSETKTAAATLPTPVIIQPQHTLIPSEWPLFETVRADYGERADEMFADYTHPFLLAQNTRDAKPLNLYVIRIDFPQASGVASVSPEDWKAMAVAIHQWDEWRNEEGRRRDVARFQAGQRDDFHRLMLRAGCDLTGWAVRRCEPNDEYSKPFLTAVVDGVTFEYTDVFDECNGMVCIAYPDGTRSQGLRSAENLGEALLRLEKFKPGPKERASGTTTTAPLLLAAAVSAYLLLGDTVSVRPVPKATWDFGSVAAFSDALDVYARKLNREENARYDLLFAIHAADPAVACELRALGDMVMGTHAAEQEKNDRLRALCVHLGIDRDRSTDSPDEFDVVEAGPNTKERTVRP